MALLLITLQPRQFHVEYQRESYTALSILLIELVIWRISENVFRDVGKGEYVKELM